MHLCVCRLCTRVSVRVHVYVQVHVCVCVCVFVWVSVYSCICVHVCVCVCVGSGVCVYVCVFVLRCVLVQVGVCVRACMRACMCESVRVCVHPHHSGSNDRAQVGGLVHHPCYDVVVSQRHRDGAPFRTSGDRQPSVGREVSLWTFPGLQCQQVVVHFIANLKLIESPDYQCIDARDYATILFWHNSQHGLWPHNNRIIEHILVLAITEITGDGQQIIRNVLQSIQHAWSHRCTSEEGHQDHHRGSWEGL